MTVVRELIAQQIKKDNPTFLVNDAPAGPPDNFGGVRNTQVSVWRSVLEKAGGTLTHNMVIELMIGKRDETLLDERLDKVLLSLQRIPGITWSRASRTVFDDKYPGYQIELTAPSADVYRATILKEQ